MFSFYKFAALIFPSLELVSYIYDPRAESDRWLSPACSLCVSFFEFRYRDKAECVRPAQSECHCTVCQAAFDPEGSSIRRGVSLPPETRSL